MVIFLVQTSNDYAFDEWKEARHVIEKFDDRQHDLRKYGFTFLSALIAADSLTKLFSGVDDRIRIAVISVTLLLTVALRILDKSYSLFMEAASVRAKVLEVKLNLELTEGISYRYQKDKFYLYSLMVYESFAIVSGLVGMLIMYPNFLLCVIVGVLVGISVIVILFVHRLTINLENAIDWSFDRIECIMGEKIRIVATNLCPKTDLSYDAGATVWEIRKEGEEQPVYTQKTPNQLIIMAGNNYSWDLLTGELPEPGTYRVFSYYAKECKKVGKVGIRKGPLYRAIIVS